MDHRGVALEQHCLVANGAAAWIDPGEHALQGRSSVQEYELGLLGECRDDPRFWTSASVTRIARNRPQVSTAMRLMAIDSLSGV